MILTLLFLASCEAQFDFEEDGQGANQFIVNGVIDNSEGPYFISVEQTVQGLQQFPKEITTACVEIIDEQGNREMCRHQGDGIYHCDGHLVKGIAGKAYRTEVTIGEVLIESSMDTMPDVIMPKYGLSWEQGQITETSNLGIDVQTDVVFVNLKAEISANSENLFLHWVGEEIYQFLQKQNFGSGTPPCYIIRNYGSDQVRLLKNQNFQGEYRLDRALFRVIDDSFLRKHLISIFQYAVSKEYFHYLEKIKILVENNGSLFDSPPGMAKGNLIANSPTEEVNGFFRSVIVDTATVAIYPSQLEGVIIQDGCSLNFTIDRCFGCPNTGKYSGFERPEYYHRIK